mgnify:FL=1
MKKLIALLMVLAMVACLFVGCDKNDKQGSDAPQGDGDVGTTQNGGNDGSSGEADYSKMKIGMLLNNTVTDGGWNQAMAESMERSKKELGLKDDQVIIVESLPDGSTEADSTIVQLVDEGCNLIIGASSGFTVNVNAAAQQYPDVYFTQFEGLSADNYCSFTCWDIEAIFMCGYAAALMSDVDELGFVAAQPQASVVRAIDAWAAGAKAANPDATVQVAWVNSWYDPAGDKECANSLLQKGIKCLGYHGSTTAVAQAAQEAGAYCTGFHIDMHDYAPKAVLTSFCWNWTPIFNEIITSIATDSFTNDVKYANMADGAATIAPWNTDIMPEDVIAKCDEMKDKIVNGEYTVMAGPLSDNKGNELLKDGETFNLEQLIDCYWLLDNVIGDLP